MHADADRLLTLDRTLRAEADALLAASGLGALLAERGYTPVGSYVMQTMAWRDLDFERYKEPDWDEHWRTGAAIAKLGWCWRLSCIDAYRQGGADQGLYWGLRLRYPSTPQGETWKLDLWTAPKAQFKAADAARARWAAALTPETRTEILVIKEAVCYTPDYRDTMLSVHIYEAVLEQGVRGVEEFRRWWEARGRYSLGAPQPDPR